MEGKLLLLSLELSIHDMYLASFHFDGKQYNLATLCRRLEKYRQRNKVRIHIEYKVIDY